MLLGGICGALFLYFVSFGFVTARSNYIGLSPRAVTLYRTFYAPMRWLRWHRPYQRIVESEIELIYRRLYGEVATSRPLGASDATEELVEPLPPFGQAVKGESR